MVAFLIMVVCYIWFDAARWLTSGNVGGTLYPPLAGLPQAVPETNSGDPVDFLLYMGAVYAGAAAATVSIGFWLAAWTRDRQRRLVPEPQNKLIWLPLVLLIPLAVHVAAMAYHAASDPQNFEESTALAS
ncbi:hypothetical protein GCM10023186_30570 [Hymenobacter koreensis]|uniref:Uncharacterized protein n=2 Tax=Hymenobacter koreensis TaxID=1084523 RepID=A0ABP8J720_9BACT